MRSIVLFIAIVLPAWLGGARAAPQDIVAEVDVNEGAVALWRRWTTQEGLETFFGRKCSIEPRVDGALDIWFFPDNPQGRRGAEGMRILAFEPERRLVFTWDAPPTLPYVRAQRSGIEVRFTPQGDARTHVRLRHFAFGDTHDEWWLARAYFESAWPVVLRRLQFAAQNGRVDWANLPENLSYTIPPKDELYRRAGIRPAAKP
jgi:uncharacterized protein YndB with AHSA1/START domain